MGDSAHDTIRGNWRRMLRFTRRLALFLAPLVLLAACAVAWMDARNQERVCTRNLREKLAAFPVPSGGYEVLVLGDSRAAFGVDPRVLARELGVAPDRCLNLGVAGGDPSSAVKALRTRPALLQGRPVVLLSVSISCLDDGAGHHTADLLSDCSFTERLGLLGPGRLASYYVDSAEHLVGAKETRAAPRGISGYTPRPETFTAHSDEDLASALRLNPWYLDVRRGFDGTRTRIVRQHLRWLASLDLPVLVFEGPLAPSWRAYVRGSAVEQADRAFTAAMGALCTQAGIRFLSLRDRDELTDGEFVDWLHTNEKGTALVSRWLADAVRAQRR